MRWSNLEVDVEQRARLPGYREEAVVRHFDAPEAVETRFYEVRAKSILNRVPESSQVPFRWTINPFRGCSHACRYCLGGETPILMADGSHKPIAELEVGDAIYGTLVGAFSLGIATIGAASLVQRLAGVPDGPGRSEGCRFDDVLDRQA